MNRLVFRLLGLVSLIGAATILPGFREAPAVALAPCPKCSDNGASGASHQFGELGANYKCEPNQCHDDALTGTCAAYHQPCNPEFASAARDLNEIEVAIENGDANVLDAVLKGYQVAVQYNAKRHAVQVFSCDGKVVAHFPLDAPVAASLE